MKINLLSWTLTLILLIGVSNDLVAYSSTFSAVSSSVGFSSSFNSLSSDLISFININKDLPIGDQNNSLITDRPVFLAQSTVRSRRNNSTGNSSLESRSTPKSKQVRSKLSDDKKNKREKFLTSEKTYKVKKGVAKDTVIDFDETDIAGERRDPSVGFVKTPVLRGGNAFVKIRREWHDTMITSTLLIE